MKINFNNNFLDYLCLAMVLSFFLIHKIILVQIGIIYALFSLNKVAIINKYKLIKRRLERKDELKISKSLESKTMKKEFNISKTRSTLVETVEELGMIPSLENNDGIDAA